MQSLSRPTNPQVHHRLGLPSARTCLTVTAQAWLWLNTSPPTVTHTTNCQLLMKTATETPHHSSADTTTPGSPPRNGTPRTSKAHCSYQVPCPTGAKHRNDKNYSNHFLQTCHPHYCQMLSRHQYRLIEIANTSLCFP